jgi:uncharacterized membrane protein YcaP (DUF421 family)
MLTILIRAIVLYSIVILTLRGMGKRQLGQLQPYELVITILIADLTASPIADVSEPLLYGLLPIAALYVVYSLLSLLSMRSDRFRALISGKPSVIISRGVIQEKELKRLCLTLADVLEGLRCAGILDPAEAGTAVMEANGTITAFPSEKKRPPNTQEMNVAAAYEGLPMVLIMDGRIQKSNLHSACLDEAWLCRMLSERGFDRRQVFLCSLDTSGRMSLQKRSGELVQFQAIEAKQVKW